MNLRLWSLLENKMPLFIIFVFCFVVAVIIGLTITSSISIVYANHDPNAFEFQTQWTVNPIVVPENIGVDAAGNIYVDYTRGDQSTYTVEKFTTTDGIHYSLSKSWGKWCDLDSMDRFCLTSGDGIFTNEAGIALDPSTSNVYVGGGGLTDTIGDVGIMQEFTTDGEFIRKWGSPCAIQDTPSAGCNANSPGAKEIGDGQFDYPGPYGVAVDSSGSVYVADYGNWRVEKFKSDGTFITKFPNPISTSQLARPWGVSVDSSGTNVYVTDPYAANKDIARFSSKDGIHYSYAGSFGFSCVNPCTVDGGFIYPAGISVDRHSGNVYVVDRLNSRVQEFTSSGGFIGWAGGCTAGKNCDVANQRSYGFTCTAATCTGLHDVDGSRAGQFINPEGITVDSSRNVYVVDASGHRIEKFTPPKDTDGDGLLDTWEKNGIDVNHDGIADLDLPALGANPMHKDIFLEIDYMEHHKEPLSAAMNEVVRAFANAPAQFADGTYLNPDHQPGINLHYIIDDMIPHQNNLNMWNDFDNIKLGSATHTMFFGTAQERPFPEKIQAKKLAYHYVIVGHTIYTPDGYTAGGVSEGAVPNGEAGNDIAIGLGDAGHDAAANSPYLVDREARLFMHELGHNLGLDHGGGDDINCKPNYLSVMNYLFDHKDNKIKPPIDYSRSFLNSLDEANLDEVAGVEAAYGPPPDNKQLYSTHGPPPPVIIRTGNPVDWNRNNNYGETGISADINNFKTVDCGIDFSGNINTIPNQVLHSYNDWLFLKYDFIHSVNFGDRSHGTIVKDADEAELAKLNLMLGGAVTDTNIISALNGTGAPVANDTTSHSVSITFNFKGQFNNTDVTDFKCSLDNAEFSACTSPQTFTRLQVGSHTFRVFGIDSESGTPDLTPAMFVWTRTNQAPIANAGPDQTVNEGTAGGVSLSGSSSNDPDGGGIFSYAWTQTAGPTVTLNSTSTANVKFDAPFLSADTTLTFQLKVTDDDGGATSIGDTVNVLVKNAAGKPNTSLSLAIKPTSVKGNAAYTASGTLKNAATSAGIPSATITVTTSSGSNIISTLTKSTTTGSRGNYKITTMKAPNTKASYNIQSDFAENNQYNPSDSAIKTLKVTSTVAGAAATTTATLSNTTNATAMAATAKPTTAPQSTSTSSLSPTPNTITNSTTGNNNSTRLSSSPSTNANKLLITTNASGSSPTATGGSSIGRNAGQAVTGPATTDEGR